MPEDNSTFTVPPARTLVKVQQQGPDSGGGFRRLLVQDCGKYAIAQGAIVINGLVLIPAITHLFPPAVYGDYVLCSAVINVGMLALAGWLGQGTLRFYPAFEREGREQFFLDWTSTVALLTVALAAILGVPVILLISGSMRAEFARLLWFTLPVTIGYSLFYVLTTYLRSARKLTLYTRTQIASAIIQPSLGLLALLIWRNIEAYFCAWLISLCVLNAWVWVRLRPRAVWLGQLREFSTGRMFAYGFPLVLSQLLTQVLLFADRYILEVIRNPLEVGLYSLGFTIGQLPMSMIFRTQMSAVYPLVMRSWERGSVDETARNIGMSIRYYVLIGVPSLVGLSLLSSSIVAVFSSTEYSRAASVIPWVAASMFLSGLAQYPLLHTHLVKKPAMQTWVMAFTAAVNVALNLLLIPRLGYSGAAVALLLSMVVLNVVSWAVGARLLPLSLPLTSFGRSAASTGIMALVIWAFLAFGHSSTRARGFGVIPPAILAYFGCLYFFGEIEPGERIAIRRLLQRKNQQRSDQSDSQPYAGSIACERDRESQQQDQELSL